MELGADYPFAYGAVGVLLYSALMTAVYVLTVAVRAWFPDQGSVKGPGDEIRDPNWEMKLPLGIFAAAVLLWGLYSEPLMQILRAIAQGSL